MDSRKETCKLAIKTINREAADKTKGFRLQKMRAIRLMLEEIEPASRSIFYTAIENVEDVSHAIIGDEGVDQYYEEDKNYDKNKNFTLFTDATINTLVSFFDIYTGNWRQSESILLGFYTTASIGKESKKLVIDGKETAAPTKPVLEVLSEGGDLSDEVFSYVKEALVQEYKSQYYGKDTDGNISVLEAIEKSKLVEFLKKITWSFGAEDEVALKEVILDLIKKSPLYTIRHANKEEIIFSLLMETLDERQNKNDLVQKVIFSPDVELLFKRAESELEAGVLDPVWVHLEEAESEVTDKRNIREKIESVCPSYSSKKTKMLARMACRSKPEQAAGNKSFLSLKYRIYEACSERLINGNQGLLTENGVDSILDNLKTLSANHIDELKKDYHYTVSNKAAISGVVMDLFDGCFIALDEVDNDE